MSLQYLGPMVSIVIPVYNGANYLREAIDSALAQTYPNCEVLVINDGSTDNGATRDIALSYGDRIRYFEKENGGVASALNLGIREMGGEFFSWLSHDDVYYPDKIEVQIEYLAKQSNKLIVLYSDYDQIDEKSKYRKTVRNKRYKPDKFCIALASSLPLHGCDALVPRECFDKIGMFDESLRTTNDYNMWFRLAMTYEFHLISKTLIKGRIHSAQDTVRLHALQLVEVNKLYCWIFDNLSLRDVSEFSGGRIGAFYVKCAFHNVKIGAYQSGFYAVKKSFKYLCQNNIIQLIQYGLYLVAFSLYLMSRPLCFWLHKLKNMAWNYHLPVVNG